MRKVDVHFSGKNLYQIGVYQRYQQDFRKRGVELRFYPDAYPDSKSDADLFLAQAEYVGPNAEQLNRPIVVEERQDSAMPISRHVISLPNVVRYFKVAVVSNYLINVRAERTHLWLLDRETTEKAAPQRAILNETEIAKIKPGIHFGMFQYLWNRVERARMRPNNDSWNDRPINALFIGTTQYGLPTLDSHRKQFCQALQSIKGLNIVCVPNRAMNRDNYFSLTQHAKIVVSPWGYGEVCYRDFEGMLDDCVVVKPNTDFVNTLDEILKSGVSYEPCRMDAGDLEQTIRAILKNPRYQDPSLRRQNRLKMLAWWEPKKLVDWWVKEIKAGTNM